MTFSMCIVVNAGIARKSLNAKQPDGVLATSTKTVWHMTLTQTTKSYLLTSLRGPCNGKVDHLHLLNYCSRDFPGIAYRACEHSNTKLRTLNLILSVVTVLMSATHRLHGCVSNSHSNCTPGMHQS